MRRILIENGEVDVKDCVYGFPWEWMLFVLIQNIVLTDKNYGNRELLFLS